ncbi:MAG: hypothetical protein OMM_08973 [Candidatus Magnetoglobus multicellularis str. Araruama]|uniref:Uncharacterized protein n=1 Tax=Candidatus Magnetoglobus multicellularis str. Araruama TaxID=890399 RepID=A0A1V1P620_9BACT|nr:MAG: hypothetical protein OMM_08973 [Candidatus Magnetoglobus multicellularis str. Araruama]
MKHRHLNHEKYTLAAIDDIIAHGRKKDWVKLRLALINDIQLKEKIMQICRAYADNPYAQRHNFWMQYAQRYIT